MLALRLSDLAGLSDADQDAALLELSRAPQSLSLAEANIKRYELRYEMPSDAMRRKVANGQMTETAEIADWLFWLASRPQDHVAR